jgi:hypothetical protein
MRIYGRSSVNRGLVTAFAASVLLVALVLTGCRGGTADSGNIASNAAENTEGSGAPLAGTTPGRPALVEFYADW